MDQAGGPSRSRADQSRWTRLAWGAVGLASLLPVTIFTARWLGLWRPAEPTVGARPASEAGLAPEFSVRTLDGRRFALADYRGRPVVLFFMAAWCSPCIFEARALARLHTEYHDRGVPDAGYAWALDREGLLGRAFNVRALDTTVVICPDGRIVYRDEVATPYETLKEVLDRIWK